MLPAGLLRRSGDARTARAQPPDGDLSETRKRLANQLRRQPISNAPHSPGLCSAADESWFWALFLAAGAPKEAAHMTQAKAKKLLQMHVFGANTRRLPRRRPPASADSRARDAVDELLQLLCPADQTGDALKAAFGARAPWRQESEIPLPRPKASSKDWPTLSPSMSG